MISVGPKQSKMMVLGYWSRKFYGDSTSNNGFFGSEGPWLSQFPLDRWLTSIWDALYDSYVSEIPWSLRIDFSWKSISLDQESRLSLIGPKNSAQDLQSLDAWEIRNWHCGASGALGGAFRLSPAGHPVTQLSPKKKETTGELRRDGAHWVSTMKRGASWGY